MSRVEARTALCLSKDAKSGFNVHCTQGSMKQRPVYIRDLTVVCPINQPLTSSSPENGATARCIFKAGPRPGELWSKVHEEKQNIAFQLRGIIGTLQSLIGSYIVYRVGCILPTDHLHFDDGQTFFANQSLMFEIVDLTFDSVWIPDT